MRPPSRRAGEMLAELHDELTRLELERAAALRRFRAARTSTTTSAQEEFWLEYIWLSQEYRFAVRKLTGYCNEVLGD